MLDAIVQKEMEGVTWCLPSLCNPKLFLVSNHTLLQATRPVLPSYTQENCRRYLSASLSAELTGTAPPSQSSLLPYTFLAACRTASAPEMVIHPHCWDSHIPGWLIWSSEGWRPFQLRVLAFVSPLTLTFSACCVWMLCEHLAEQNWGEMAKESSFICLSDLWTHKNVEGSFKHYTFSVLFKSF